MSFVYLYFYTFYFLVNIVFMNLFIAIILDGYNQSQLKESRLVNADTLERFRDVWSDFDPDVSISGNSGQA